MENWLSVNWFPILTTVLLVSTWVYQLGFVRAEIETMKREHGKDRETLASVIKVMQEHLEDSDRHVTPPFMQMCNDRHNSILSSVSRIEGAVTRLEGLAMEARGHNT